jgi:hypothetical protein
MHARVWRDNNNIYESKDRNTVWTLASFDNDKVPYHRDVGILAKPCTMMAWASSYKKIYTGAPLLGH